MLWYKENPHVNMEGGTIVELVPIDKNEKTKYWGKGNVKNPFNPNAPIILSGQMKVKSLEEAINIKQELEKLHDWKEVKL